MKDPTEAKPSLINNGGVYPNTLSHNQTPHHRRHIDEMKAKDLDVWLAFRGSGSASRMCKSLTRMAILSVSLSFKDMLNYKKSSMNKRGDFLLPVGSPFGVLSPTHFFNRVSYFVGINCFY
ncbi:hypothetical protein P8452_03696 [Trifolium repens]|nr:hypothetical protein P8452_03696 [Trifolium repens]